MNKILVTRKLPAKILEKLKPQCQLDIWDSDEVIPRAELLKKVQGKDGILCMLTDKIDKELLDAAGPQLKAVSTMSVGYDHIDVKECSKRQIAVGFTPGVLDDAVADLTITLMLMASRRTAEAVETAKSGTWSSWRPYWMCGLDLSGSRVGIIGLGHIGGVVAKRLQGFDCKLNYYNRGRVPELEKELGIKYCSLNELLESCDFISVHVPLTPQTKAMINSAVLTKMKPNAILINTSRGEVIDQDALYKALKTGQIYAAGLDVTYPEPLPTNHPLFELANCTITPHIASATMATRNKMANLAVENLLAGINKTKLVAQVKI